MPTRKLVEVYQYRLVDPVTGRAIISYAKMTAEGIARIGAQIIADTEQEVWEGALDENGRYFPTS